MWKLFVSYHKLLLATVSHVVMVPVLCSTVHSSSKIGRNYKFRAMTIYILFLEFTAVVKPVGKTLSENLIVKNPCKMTSIFLNPQAHSLAHIWEKNIWPFTKREESGEVVLLLLIHDYSKHSKFVQQSNRFIAPTSHDLFLMKKQHYHVFTGDGTYIS